MLNRITNIIISIILVLFLAITGLLSYDPIRDPINNYKEKNLIESNDLLADINVIEQPHIDFIRLSEKDKEYLIDVSYQAIDDYFTGEINKDLIFDERFDNTGERVFIGFRINGRKKGSYSAQKTNLAESVYEATLRTIEDKRYDGSITEDDTDRLKIEIIIIGDEKPLDSGYEKGIHGIRMVRDNNEATYYNSVAIEGNHEQKRLLEKLCKKAGLPENCSGDDSTSIYYFPTIHFATTRFSQNIVTYYRCHDPEPISELSVEKIESALDLAKNWLFSNFNYYGLFNYEYYPSNGNYSDKNNIIRQLMASRILAIDAVSQKDLVDWNTANRMHKKNLETIFDKFYREEGENGYIYFGQKSKLGSMALAIRLITSSPYFEKYEDIADRLANTIIDMQNEDGSFVAWYIEPDYLFDEERLLKFYSGQAILSMVELYEKTGNVEYLDAAVKSQDHYIEEYVTNINDNYYPAYVPWHTMALYKLYMNTGEEKYKNAVYVLNDELIQMQDQEGKPYIDYLGRFFDPGHTEYGPPFSGSTAIYTEGLTYAYELAVLDNDFERTKEYIEAILLGAHNLINLQFRDSDMYYLSNPERVEGAVKYSVDDNIIRVDTTQHTIEALDRVLEIIY